MIRASDIPDTAEGGRLAHENRISYYDVVIAQKPTAAAAWLETEHERHDQRYAPRWSAEKKAAYLTAWVSGASVVELMENYGLSSSGAVTKTAYRCGATEEQKLARREVLSHLLPARRAAANEKMKRDTIARRLAFHQSALRKKSEPTPKSPVIVPEKKGKERKCLTCGNQFWSESIGHRLCSPCRAKTGNEYDY